MKYCTVCKSKYEDSVSFCPVDGEVLEDDPSSIVNTVLDGQYQIETMLGKGGMGAVYRARHILLGDRVAIKIMPPEVRNNAEWLRRFRREGQAARRFRHPNAVTVYDLRTAGDGTIYMVMEYVEGHTLDAELKLRGRLTPAEAVEILEPIMSVLNTAHSMGVVHRDLKPENIMIGKGSNAGEPVVKLLDLGIAKMREIAGSDNGGTTALTMAGQVLGTPYYMSPEQWGEIPRDGSSEIDGRADLYSLGLVIYEMVAGRRPCSGTTLSELRREHVSVAPRPLHEVVPGVAPVFSQAVARAVAKDRGDRQSSAGELAAELRLALGKAVPSNLDRTVPDLPLVHSSSSPTKDIPGAISTASDVNAPTIITIDSAPTGEVQGAAAETAPRRDGPSGERAPTPAPFNLQSPTPALSAPTVFESANLDESVTVQQKPKVIEAPEPPAKRGSMLFVGAGVLILMLLVLGVGGFFAVRWMRGSSEDKATAENGKGVVDNPPLESSATELGRYWLELLPDQTASEPVRVAGVVPLASGQKFKLHFQFREGGHLYIVGPGEQNQPTVFLSAKPIAESGLENNQVKAGVDFSFPTGSFPDGSPHSLTLDMKAGTEDYVVIFSPTPMSQAFLSAPVTGDPLTKTEQAELNDLLAKHQGNEAKTELNDKNSAEPFIQIKVPASLTGAPIVFRIRIQHK